MGAHRPRLRYSGGGGVEIESVLGTAALSLSAPSNHRTTLRSQNYSRLLGRWQPKPNRLTLTLTQRHPRMRTCCCHRRYCACFGVFPARATFRSDRAAQPHPSVSSREGERNTEAGSQAHGVLEGAPLETHRTYHGQIPQADGVRGMEQQQPPLTS